MARFESAKIKYVDARDESKNAHEISDHMNRENTGDCVARAFTHSTSWSYDDVADYITSETNKQYATSVPLPTVQKMAKDFGFDTVSFPKYSRVQNVAMIAKYNENCIVLCGKTRSKPCHAVAIVDSIIYDVFDSSQYAACAYYVPTANTPVPETKKAIRKTDEYIVHKDGEIVGTFKELADKVLTAKRNNPKVSWTKLIEALNLERQDGYKIRRSDYFQNQLTAEESAWALKPAKK